MGPPSDTHRSTGWFVLPGSVRRGRHARHAGTSSAAVGCQRKDGEGNHNATRDQRQDRRELSGQHHGEPGHPRRGGPRPLCHPPKNGPTLTSRTCQTAPDRLRLRRTSARSSRPPGTPLITPRPCARLGGCPSHLSRVHPRGQIHTQGKSTRRSLPASRPTGHSSDRFSGLNSTQLVGFPVPVAFD